MKKLIALLLVAGLVGAATYFGWHRDGARDLAKPEVEQKLLLAEKFLERREADKALGALDELATAGYRIGETGALLRLRALEQAGRHQAAASEAARFLKDYPNSTARATAEYVRLSAEVAGGGLSNPAVRDAVESFLRDNPGHSDSIRLEAALARQDVRNGDLAAAERRLAPLLMEADRRPEVFEAARLLADENMARLLAPTPGPDCTIHKVRSGDTINTIARAHGVTEELVLRANGITDPRRLRIGQELRVPSVNFTLHVDLASNLMELRNKGRYFKLYKVRTGREEGTTPTGQFRILNKKRAPTWRPGNGDVYGPGDPNNELGTRWMSFEGDILGIHGTIHPETVGEYASNGCVGMITAEVEELFDLVTVGTPLEIRGQRDLQRHRVIPAAPLQRPREVAASR
jgi:LysM repeat protein